MAIDYINIKIIDRFENDRTMQVEQTQIGAPKLSYAGSDDKYASIMATEFSFNLTVTDKTDGKFFHLYTGNEKRYYVLVEDQDLNMIFEGYLLPDFYEEPYTNSVIFVGLTATDGIGLLKGAYLPNIYYKQETSVIKLIAECLKLTKLKKNINLSAAIESAVTDYGWDEIVVNGREYLEGEGKIRYTGLFFQTEIMPSRKSAYDILELLIKNIGCTLYPEGDQWYIEGINRKHEVLQLNEVYNFEGLYLRNEVLTKQVVDVVFFATPTVSIKSPWKFVNVSWDIDEDGDLVPDWGIEETNIPGVITLEGRKQDVYDFWKPNGVMGVSVFSKKPEYISQSYVTGTVVAGAFPFSIITGNNAPRNLEVKFQTAGSGGISYGQNPATLETNFLDIKNKKYLKISDDYIERKVVIDYKFVSKVRLGMTAPEYDAIIEQDFVKSYKNDFLVGDNILLSSKINDDSLLKKKAKVAKNDANWDADQSTQWLELFLWTPSRISAELKAEDLIYSANGFFNIKLHPPISNNYMLPWFYDYVVQDLNVKVTALKKWEHFLEREIDFTTSYDLDIFHGDSIADLTERNFRFRRYIAPPESLPGEINIISKFILNNSFFDTWNFVISYEQAQLIISNPFLFLWNLAPPVGPKTMDQIYGVSTTFGLQWGVGSESGVWFLTMIVPVGNPYFTDINNFNEAFFDTNLGDVIYGLVPEDNEWRESWKRYGQAEDIRFGIALGKIYHDVQSGPLVVVEGVATELIFPRQIMQFQWLDIKQFIPARVDIDFSTGRTNIFMIESKHQIVTDYAYE